ncbi:NUDIX domain-containing protein [Alkalihalobacterium bogoriense]|uniref:NUDIX domain-containing protein n=1 Tax=Alkalihalobacterium bogoriense TaxID=246272 RepID=UPI000479FF63|nr:NUDIX hydrolase [Alkalihalobacterium bogoriense]
MTDQTEEEFLKKYDPTKYRTPDGYTADIAVFTIAKDNSFINEEQTTSRVLKLLLIKRGDNDSEGNPNIEGNKWALPGGFIDPGETAYEAAIRELEEETKVTNIHVQHFNVYDKEGRDPRGWIISNAHYAIVQEKLLESRKGSDDAKEVALFSIQDVFKLDLAFDHNQIIKDALAFITRDMLETTVAKNFLPQEFILSDLRDVLLAVAPASVLGTKSSFFRKAPTLPFIELVTNKDGEPKMTVPTKESKRPTRLYRFVDYQSVHTIYR